MTKVSHKWRTWSSQLMAGIERYTSRRPDLSPGFTRVLVVVSIIALAAAPPLSSPVTGESRYSPAGDAQPGDTVVVAAEDSPADLKAVADYVCDGTNDQVEIQAAIGALPATSGTVALLEGTFIITIHPDISGIRLYADNVTLKGQGYSTVLKLAPGDTASPGYLVSVHGNYVTISDLCLDGNSAESPGANTRGIDVYTRAGASDLTVSHVWIRNFAEDGIGSAEPERLRVVDCRFSGMGDDAIDVNKAKYAVVKGSTFEGIYDKGIDLDAPENCSFIENTFENLGGYAIDIERESISIPDLFGEYNRVEGNVIKNSRCGVWLHYARNNSIIGNTIIGCRTGIPIAGDSTNNIITGNIIADATTGIDIGSSSLGNDCSSNSFINVTSPVVDAGTDNKFDREPKSATLDLSGAATDTEVFCATGACWLTGYTVLYIEGSSGDTGVTIRVGRLQADGSSDSDYYDSVTSETSRARGYSRRYGTPELTQSTIASGETVTAGTKGAKSGAGEVQVILHIATLYEGPFIVAGSTPAGGDIPPSAPITVTFRETVDRTAAQDAFSISPAVPGIFSWDGNTMIFTPTAGLGSSETYTVTVSGEATDLQGNPSLVNYSWQFTTSELPGVALPIAIAGAVILLAVVSLAVWRVRRRSR